MAVPIPFVDGNLTAAALNYLNTMIADLQASTIPGPWTQVTLLTGYTNGATNVQVRKAPDGLQFRGELVIATALTGTAVQIGAMPSGFTVDQRYIVGIAGAGNAPVPVRFDLRADGTIWLSGTSVRGYFDGLVIPSS